MNIRVKVGEQTFDVEVGSLATRPVLAVVDGETFEVWPDEAGGAASVKIVKPKPAEASAPIEPGVPVPAPCSDGGGIVTAPIPGVIISISVKPGDTVKIGQELCMLEAMKMKNPIRATREAKIVAVLVNTGDHVKHAQPLVEYS